MTPGAEAGAAPSPPKPLFGSCWSCRVLSGVGLLLAGLWIYQGPRQTMKRGIPPSMGTIAQITFALGVAGWGVVILVDPVGKQQRKLP